jgi:hypothetical protein
MFFLKVKMKKQYLDLQVWVDFQLLSLKLRLLLAITFWIFWYLGNIEVMGFTSRSFHFKKLLFVLDHLRRNYFRHLRFFFNDMKTVRFLLVFRNILWGLLTNFPHIFGIFRIFWFLRFLRFLRFLQFFRIFLILH